MDAQSKSSNAIELTIQGRAKGPVISRDIFGQFAEHLGSGIYGGVWVGEDSTIPNVRGIRSDVVQALRALHVPNVRWPGGCFADEYHWRDGIGPRNKRYATVNSNWGGAKETNQFGSNEYFDFIEQIGSEAYVSVNVGSGTVKEAADWLTYLTADQSSALGHERALDGRDKPFKVKFVGIGNESWGCGGSMSPGFYVDQLKMYSRFVRNYNPAQTGESAMRRIAVGPNGDDSSYTEAVMSAWKNRPSSWDIEGLSLHFYTTDGWPPHYDSVKFGEGEYAALIADAFRMDKIIGANTRIMDHFDPQNKVGLYVDEWGVWLAPLPDTNPGFLVQQNSLRDAIIASLNLNIFARHAERVRGANIAQMINVLQAMVLTDGPRMILTPTYHVFRMYVPFQDAQFVPARFEAGIYEQGKTRLPRVDAIAARDPQGILWLALANIDPNVPARFHLSGDGKMLRSATGEVLTAPQVNSLNTFDVPNAVRPQPMSEQNKDGRLEITLPSKSVAVFRIEE